MNDNKPEKPAAVILIEAAIGALRQRGITSAYGIAKALNEQGITTPRGCQWHAIQVQRIMANGTTERARPR
jgi:hypothetical protein